MSMSKSTIFRTPEEEEMLVEVNKIDKEKKDYAEAIAAEHAKKSGFVKLLRWNAPKILIVIGGILNAFNGFIQPASGIIMSKLLSLMSLPPSYLVDKENPEIKGMSYLKQEVIFWAVAYSVCGCTMLFTYFIAKKSFGTLGENVTLSVRKVLYEKIM